MSAVSCVSLKLPCSPPVQVQVFGWRLGCCVESAQMPVPAATKDQRRLGLRDHAKCVDPTDEDLMVSSVANAPRLAFEIGVRARNHRRAVCSKRIVEAVPLIGSRFSEAVGQIPLRLAEDGDAIGFCGLPLGDAERTTDHAE